MTKPEVVAGLLHNYRRWNLNKRRFNGLISPDGYTHQISCYREFEMQNLCHHLKEFTLIIFALHSDV